jgi:murein DD-endopeptidase MepM/ murein hydrolase activator NlpD
VAPLLVVAFVATVASPAAAEETPGLSEARARARAATSEMNQAQTRLGELSQEIERAESEAAAAEADLEVLRSQVRELAIRQYTETDDVPGLVAQDLNAQERAKVLVESVSQVNVDAVDQYRAARQRLDRERAILESSRAEESEQLESLQSSQAALDAELSRLESLESQRVEQERQRKLEEARQAAQAEQQAAAEADAAQLARRQDATAAGRAVTATTAPASSSGGAQAPAATAPSRPAPSGPIASGAWVCPVQGAKSFIDSWGASRASGNRHQGVDIMSPRGTPAVMPVSGTVSFKTGGIGGLTYRVNGDDGNWYYGAHLDAYAGLSPGHHPAGTVVGYVGDTGDARGTGAHLHFEIHIGGYGNAINPYPTTAAHC